MKRIIISIVIVFSAHGYAQTHTGNWTIQKVSSDSEMRAVSLFFVDSAVGYTGCQYFPLYTLNVINKSYRTLDGGLTWTQMIPAVDVGNFGTSAPTHNSIFYITPSYLPPIHLYRSLDNGDHWDSNIVSNLRSGLLFQMFSEKDGIGIDDSLPFILKTKNGGNTFTGSYHDSLFTACVGTTNSGSGNYQSQFSDELHGTFRLYDPINNKGNGISTLLTSDGGNSWKKYHSDFPGYENYALGSGLQYQKSTPNLWNIPGTDSPNAWECFSRVNLFRGQSTFNMAYCFSADYGATWVYDTSYARQMSAFYGVSPGNVWMLLHEGTQVNDRFPAYKIAHTTDFGKSWDIDSTSLKNDGLYDAQAIYFTDENHGWITAINEGHPYILIYHPEKNSVITQATVNEKLSVFPMPAIDHVSIKLSSDDLPVQVEIYDLVGRRYFPSYKIINSIFQLDTHDLPAGIWFAVIKHSYGSSTVRFIVQK